MTFKQICAKARLLLRSAHCPLCNSAGFEDSEDCAWCDERAEFTATHLLRSLDDVVKSEKKEEHGPC